MMSNTVRAVMVGLEVYGNAVACDRKGSVGIDDDTAVRGVEGPGARLFSSRSETLRW